MQCGPILSCLCVARGNPTDQFSPINLSKTKMAFGWAGLAVVKVNESRAQAGPGGGGSCSQQQPQEEQCWMSSTAGQALLAGCAAAAAPCAHTPTAAWRASSCRGEGREGWDCPPQAHAAFGDLTPLMSLILNLMEACQNQTGDP